MIILEILILGGGVRMEKTDSKEKIHMFCYVLRFRDKSEIMQKFWKELVIDNRDLGIWEELEE